jgi:GNAT superfamily N-acetyltransferase
MTSYGLKTIIVPNTRFFPKKIKEYITSYNNIRIVNDPSIFDNNFRAANNIWLEAFGKPKNTNHSYTVVVYKFDHIREIPVAAATISLNSGVCIQSVAANPKGHGYGTVLMRNIINFSTSVYPNSPIYLHLDYTESIDRITKFYQKFGFVVAPEFMAYTDEDGIAMVLIPPNQPLYQTLNPKK